MSGRRLNSRPIIILLKLPKLSTFLQGIYLEKVLKDFVYVIYYLFITFFIGFSPIYSAPDFTGTNFVVAAPPLPAVQ